ncbi:MAG TPA: hypothetical protein PKM21_04710 [Anaerolineales bacterium]|nr:hypothetical protein [Anaerolineales bacterium]
MKMSVLDRILLFATGLLAAYQVAVGIDGFDTVPIIAYTTAFGVLLIAGLLLIILGFDVLDAPIVVVISTIIPLALSLGLVWQHLPAYRSAYLAFVILGLLAVIVSRTVPIPGRLPVMILALVHGLAGIIIFLLPIWLALQSRMGTAFSLVGVGGALIGAGGLLLSFLKAGKPILARTTILRILPGLLLLMTICFVAGFVFG